MLFRNTFCYTGWNGPSILRAVNTLCIQKNPEENFTAQILLLYGYGAIKELNESSHFSVIVVFFGLKHSSFVSPKIP